MKYISTRGQTEPVSFSDAVMMGLASDGGLLLPDQIPDISSNLSQWSKLSYKDLAFEIMKLYVDFSDNVLRDLINKSYSTFRHEEITPLVSVNDMFILELFHGPTLAFKDVALQFLGNLFEHVLEERDEHMNILAATSGDTGSAAIYGVRGKERIKIFVMHPKGKVSETQERQMTSVLDENVFNIAVEGTFDDCQNIMKAVFRDIEFKEKLSLGTVNSINWARLLAQIVYYFYAAFRVSEQKELGSTIFSVPTGNFGDIFAGYIAVKMGLPVKHLILATNENDILSRFYNTGKYSLGAVHATYSPSMDIQVASNFERYLYYREGENPEMLREIMELFTETGKLEVAPLEDGSVDKLIKADSVDNETTLQIINKFYKEYDYLLDPHTAVGVCAGSKYQDENTSVVCLATAHPAKFGKAILKSTGKDLAHHPVIDGLCDLPTRCETLSASTAEIRDFMQTRA